MNLNLLVKQLEQTYLTSKVHCDLKKGRAYQIDVLIQEGDKKRIQSYSGILVKLHKAGLKSTMTVRKLSKGIGVERVFPTVNPDIVAIKQLELKTKHRLD